MKKILNGIFIFTKYLMFFASFAISFYIVLFMYKRVEKDIIESIPIFLPFFLILVLFIINLIVRQKQISSNLFYNLTCTLVFLTTVVVGLRTLFDSNMILNGIMSDHGINFIYFNDYIPFMKVLYYGLCLSNILFMVKLKEIKKEKIEPETIAKKIEVELL